MGEDLSFNKIMKRLKEIHTEFPNMRFGQVLQTALDTKTRLTNVDFHDRSSKEILTSLDSFHTRIKIKNKKFKEDR